MAWAWAWAWVCESVRMSRLCPTFSARPDAAIARLPRLRKARLPSLHLPILLPGVLTRDETRLTRVVLIDAASLQPSACGAWDLRGRLMVTCRQSAVGGKPPAQRAVPRDHVLASTTACKRPETVLIGGGGGVALGGGGGSFEPPEGGEGGGGGGSAAPTPQSRRGGWGVGWPCTPTSLGLDITVTELFWWGWG